ncbi:uncharacterized protein LOC101237885 isoform X1 [Hydra vulgaris]|uniref:uncharacterized protein LOC101237885 isoform X1 n=1 Tax=Hydra vulgaris TaxID=6087 RepID=UPI000640E2F7|nr:uncharacterized protein LOC101237885 isoform X1 [Hydra vulgaris]
MLLIYPLLCLGVILWRVSAGTIEVIQSPFNAIVGSSVKYSWKLSYDPATENVVKLTFSDGGEQALAEGNFTHFYLTKFGVNYNTKISVNFSKNEEYSVVLYNLSYSDGKTYKLDAEFFLEQGDLLLLESHPEIAFPLTVKGGPAILTRTFPSVWTLHENSEHNPSIQVQGKPKPNVEWYLGDTDSLPGSSISLDNNIYIFSAKFKADAGICGSYLRYKVSGVQGTISAETQIRIHFKESPLWIKKQDYCISVDWHLRQHGNCSTKYVINFLNKTLNKVYTSTVSSQVNSVRQCYGTIQEVNEISDVKVKLVHKDFENDLLDLSYPSDEPNYHEKVAPGNPPLNLLTISVISGCGAVIFVVIVVSFICLLKHKKQNRQLRKEFVGEISHPFNSEPPRYVFTANSNGEQEMFLKKSKADSNFSLNSLQNTHYMVPRPYSVEDHDFNYQTIDDNIPAIKDSVYTNMTQSAIATRRC